MTLNSVSTVKASINGGGSYLISEFSNAMRNPLACLMIVNFQVKMRPLMGQASVD